MVMQQEAVLPKPHLALDQEKWGKYLFIRESFAKGSEDSLPLIDANYEEIGQFQDLVPLDVDWDGLLYYESRGQLLAFSLRLEDSNEMIGYAMYIISPTLHARNTLHAISDVIYLKPEWRKGLVGIKFMDFCERHCKQAGAVVMHTVMKFANAESTTRMMERRGHRIYEITYMKVL